MAMTTIYDLLQYTIVESLKSQFVSTFEFQEIIEKKKLVTKLVVA